MYTLKLKSILVIALFLLAGCKRNTQSTKDITETAIDSLTNQFSALKDSVKQSWKRMIIDDDEKLFNIKRLLEEITYTSDFDKGRLDSLLQKHQNLIALRYNDQTMADSDLIDEYDAKTGELILEVAAFAKKHPKYNNYPLMEQLIIEIYEADNRVLLHRIRYDDFCRQFNQLLENHAGSLTAVARNEDLRKRALFTIAE